MIIIVSPGVASIWILRGFSRGKGNPRREYRGLGRIVDELTMPNGMHYKTSRPTVLSLGPDGVNDHSNYPN